MDDFFFFFFVRQSLAVQPRLASNLQSSCFSLHRINGFFITLVYETTQPFINSITFTALSTLGKQIYQGLQTLSARGTITI
jgi:succinate dehydrogenase/fumarate reductase cytochrome b subunit